MTGIDEVQEMLTEGGGFAFIVPMLMVLMETSGILVSNI